MSLGSAAIKLRLPVFACGENKRPVVEHGFKDATTDPFLIAEQFRKPGAVLIGMPTGEVSGFLVIDIDIKPDADGRAWLDANRERLPQTRTHKTRSGGLHLVLRHPQGVNIRNSASKLAPGVDVRGNGGYVIVPPSPDYQVADPCDPADVPAWLLDLLVEKERPPLPPRPAEPRAPRQDGGSRYGLAALERECEAIRTAPFGQQETTINEAGLKIGALVAGGELDEGIALGDLKAAARGTPSMPGMPAWTVDQLEAKVRRGFEDGKLSPRQAPPPEARTVRREDGPMPPDVPDAAYADVAPSPKPKPTPEEAAKAAAAQRAAGDGLPLVFWGDIAPDLSGPRDFIEGLIEEKAAAVLYGESNSGKTFLALDLALHTSAGIAWFGREVEQGGVVYVVAEGGGGFARRVEAWRRTVRPHADGPPVFFAAVQHPVDLRTQGADTWPLIVAVEEAAKRWPVPVKLIVVDTLSRAMAGGNENASEDMGALVANMDAIRNASGAAVLFVHHTGKDATKGARGHSLLKAALDTEIEVTAPDGSGSGKTRKMRVSKQRDMEYDDAQAFGFALKSVPLGEDRRGKAITSCVVERVADAAMQTEDADGSGKALTGHNLAAFKLLDVLTRKSGVQHPACPEGTASVPIDWWKKRFIEKAAPGDKEDTKERTFRRVSAELNTRGKIEIFRDRVWIV